MTSDLAVLDVCLRAFDVAPARSVLVLGYLIGQPGGPPDSGRYRGLDGRPGRDVRALRPAARGGDRGGAHQSRAFALDSGAASGAPRSSGCAAAAPRERPGGDLHAAGRADQGGPHPAAADRSRSGRALDDQRLADCPALSRIRATVLLDRVARPIVRCAGTEPCDLAQRAAARTATVNGHRPRKANICPSQTPS